MAFQLAPYNNAMRLGQGFNSYTQQICIDDAVVIDAKRAENVLTNDGSTMRIMVQSMGKPSAWSRQKEIVLDDRDKHVEGETQVTNPDSSKPVTAKSQQPEMPKDPVSDAAPVVAVESAGQQTSSVQEQNGAATDAEDNAAATVGNETEEVVGDDPEDGDAEDPADEGAHNIPSGANGMNPNGMHAKAGKVNGVKAATSQHVSPTTSHKLASAKDSQVADVVRGTQSKPIKPATVLKKPSLKDTRSAVGKPDDVDWSNYTSQGASASADAEKKALMEAERERELEEKKLRRERERDMREAEKERKEEEKRRREEQKKNVEWAASTLGYTKEELAAMKHNIKFEERFNGMLENKHEFEYDTTLANGPSQIVTYTSRFVDKLSDITDDMNISGSLSIKAGKFGGSGRGAFIDSDKFKESDLNFYISVKVVNQTINFKDALEYNPIRSVNKDNFREVFGDSFISGFQEGGEFNALVSMKILNKAKKTDIQAEAKVAFTAGPVDIKAEANVNVAKANIETNTETTIQVSWSGGGHIKPREQQWDIQSLMQAAARFPDMVAECPQRTYAIITKYDTLRSFVMRKPAAYTPLQYENAQLYTNAMMDTFMSYKNLYTKVGSYIYDVQSKSKVIKPWPETPKETAEIKDGTTAEDSPTATLSPFPATIAGLEAARKAIRRQMAIIVNEVDVIEQDPKKATDDDHVEPYQTAAAFEERIPVVEPPEKPKITAPLGGKRIMAKTQTDEAYEAEAEADATQSPALTADTDRLSLDEQSALDKLKEKRPAIGKNLRGTAPVGSQTKGLAFNNLDFLQPEWNMTKIQIEIVNGAVSAFWIHYDNGLILSRGKTKSGRLLELADFSVGERIIAATIQTGATGNDSGEARVISLHFYTNRGRNLVGQAAKCSYDQDKKQHSRDGVLFTNVVTACFDIPMKDGNVKGLWGRSDDKEGIIWRLGIVWGDLNPVPDAAIQGDIVVTDPITAAHTESAKLLETLQAKYDTALKSAETAGKELARCRDDGNKLLQEVANLKGAALSFNHNSNWKSERVQIYHIIYGGQSSGNDDYARRCIQHAENGWEFRFNNDFFFGWDPIPGCHKMGAILYRYHNSGEMRCLVKREGESARFDPL